MEIWKDICGYKGLYKVSSLGRVKSLNYRVTGREKNLKPYKCKTGYLYVNLYKNSKVKSITVHRLVAKAFVDNPDNKPHIDHINAIKDDNRVENLRWCTAKENNDNPISRKRYFDNSPTAGKFGKDNYKSKQVYQYSLDNKFIREWNSIMDIQRELGFNSGNISSCCLGKQKTAYNYKWEYV